MHMVVRVSQSGWERPVGWHVGQGAKKHSCLTGDTTSHQLGRESHE